MTEEKKLTGYPSVDRPWLKYYTAAQISAPLPRMTAYDYLKQQNAQRLDYTAIDSEMGCYTYGELFAQIDAAAKALWAMGIKKGKRVLAMFPALPHESFLFYGIDAVGAALCQIAPMYTPTEVCRHINRIGAELFFSFDLILTPEMERMVYEETNVRCIIVIQSAPMAQRDPRTLTWDAFMALGRDLSLPDIHRVPDDVLFLGSTGGSTGEPKSVMLSDNCFNTAVHQILNTPLDYRPGDSWLRLWPIFSVSACCANHHMPLCAGMRMVLRYMPMDMSNFDRIILDNRPNHLMLIPQLLDQVEHSPLIAGQDLSFIRSVGCGGMAITLPFEERVAAFFERHNIDAFLGYGWGCSECCAMASNRTSRATVIPGTSGVPMAHTLLAAFDTETDLELPYDAEGELCICSPTLMLGYYNDPDATNRVIRTHADGRRWLHTGDLGSVSSDGFVSVRGRMTRTIFVSSSAKIYPQSMESEIARLPGVMEVVICAVPHPENDGFFAPVCCVVPEDMAEAEAVKASVADFCERSYSADARPIRVFIREHLPLTRGNKPDILLLEKEAAALLRG